MAYLKTLAELRTSIENQCDDTFGDDEVITTAEANDYINTSIAWVHGEMVQSGLSYSEETQSITTSGGGLATYDLATDFYAKVGVDCYVDGYWSELYELMPQERNNYQSSQDTYPSAFRIVGDEITFYPPPAGQALVRVLYVPTPPVLEDDDDSFNFGNAWNELVEVDCTIKVLQKLGDPTGTFERRKEEIQKRLKKEIEQRSMTQPLRFIETPHMVDPWDAGRWGWNRDD